MAARGIACCSKLGTTSFSWLYRKCSATTPRSNTASLRSNAADEVVGLYVDASIVEHGFILNGGVYTQLDPPQSTSTIAFGVNDAGTISGSYTDASNNDHGFLYSGGIFTEWMWPGRRGHN
jgi:hypothetical protein